MEGSIPASEPKIKRKTSLDVHVEQVVPEDASNGWFTRQIGKIILMFLLTLANIVAAVLLAVIQRNMQGTQGITISPITTSPSN